MSTLQPMPQEGDEWEFKIPGKSKKRKIVGELYPNGWYGSGIPTVSWERRNKGRYTGITVENLRTYGVRLSTKAERAAHFRGIVNAARKRAGKAPLESL